MLAVACRLVELLVAIGVLRSRRVVSKVWIRGGRRCCRDCRRQAIGLLLRRLQQLVLVLLALLLLLLLRSRLVLRLRLLRRLLLLLRLRLL